ncbi:TPA: hypothetical protein RE968_003385 [Pseudomonas aeruginosa]|nr:hypothetical protein [Pseudomonas aeruginosa]
MKLFVLFGQRKCDYPGQYALVVPVVLNSLAGGLLDSFKQLGLSFDPQVLSCTINAQAQIEGAGNN